MSGEGVVLRVGSSRGGQRGDEHRLQGDQDLAEGRLLHQTLQLLEVDAHAEGGAVTVHLEAEGQKPATFSQSDPILSITMKCFVPHIDFIVRFQIMWTLFIMLWLEYVQC